jgi:hypothetical protein
MVFPPSSVRPSHNFVVSIYRAPPLHLETQQQKRSSLRSSQFVFALGGRHGTNKQRARLGTAESLAASSII